MTNYRFHFKFALLQHLREEFPGPESDPRPELSEENSSGQVRFDLRQQLCGLLVQTVGVRQQAVIHDLLLRDERSHISIHSPAPTYSHFSVSAQNVKKNVPLRPMSMEPCGENEVSGTNPLCPANGRKAGDHWGKYVTLIELCKAPKRRGPVRCALICNVRRCVTSHFTPYSQMSTGCTRRQKWLAGDLCSEENDLPTGC